jgi:hypothetical protein
MERRIRAVVSNYLVSYEYKIKDGCLVSTKTETKIFRYDELEKLTRANNYYDNYVKVLFCQKF